MNTSDYSWQNKAKYARPVQFADNQLATQIVNASEILAELLVMVYQLELANKLGPTVVNRTKALDLRREANLVRDHIRTLAKGQIV